MLQLKKIERWREITSGIINKLVDRINILSKVTGRNGIKVTTSPTGIHLAGNSSNIQARYRLAYCKNDAGAASTIVCYLDTDTTGAEITVTCSIAGGGNLNAAVPRLTDGLRIVVIKVGLTWHCVTTFNNSMDC